MQAGFGDATRGAIWRELFCSTAGTSAAVWKTTGRSDFPGPAFGQPSFRFLYLNPLRLEAGDSRPQTRVPELGVKGLSSLEKFSDPSTIVTLSTSFRPLFAYTLGMSRYDRPSHQVYMYLLRAGRLGGSIPRSGSQDPAAAEVDLHRPGEDPGTGAARRSVGRLREPADARARH